MLLPFQGASPNIHRPRALPWAGCLLAFQAVTSQKLYRTPIILFQWQKITNKFVTQTKAGVLKFSTPAHIIYLCVKAGIFYSAMHYAHCLKQVLILLVPLRTVPRSFMLIRCRNTGRWAYGNAVACSNKSFCVKSYCTKRRSLIFFLCHIQNFEIIHCITSTPPSCRSRCTCPYWDLLRGDLRGHR